MATCDIDALLASGKCYHGVTGQQSQVLITQLLCEWLAVAGGSTPEGSILDDDGNPILDDDGNPILEDL